ncbi:hypothetical protein [Streptomyces sp. NPDC056921]|uniref:hypothetical protein n=1 Tax=Streptomyces sp. NPDC056921 TaxID=3345966 RepID=UPI00364495A4
MFDFWCDSIRGSPLERMTSPGGRCQPDRVTALPRRRVYGSDHDDPAPYEQPDREYVELVGGALDGQLVGSVRDSEQRFDSSSGGAAVGLARVKYSRL